MTIALTTEARLTHSYRCVLTDAQGNTLITDVVKVGAVEAFEIVTQPVNAEGALGDTVTFTVEATGVVSYQWQYCAVNSTKWVNWAGQTTETMTLKLSTENRMTNSYRCLLTDAQGNTLTTDVVTVTNNKIELDGVVYEKTDDGLVIVSYSGTEASVTIPETVEGLTVIKVGASAFEGNTTLTSIDLPDTIQVIGERAFANCTSLSTMN